MTDRINSLFVVLTKDVCENTAQNIISAISMIKGVLSVESHVIHHADHIAYHRVRHELIEKLWNVLSAKGG